MVTLLFFVTNGECPIYDRFAMRALLAIKHGCKPGDTINSNDAKPANLPCKSDKNFTQKAADVMKDYICLLQEIFGDEYKTNREIDRALWVYGHLFKEDSASESGC